LSHNGLLIFVTRPVALLFLIIGIAALAFRARTLSQHAKEASLKDA
jgi:putative tricarboxylic transport membrane protein